MVRITDISVQKVDDQKPQVPMETQKLRGPKIPKARQILEDTKIIYKHKAVARRVCGPSGQILQAPDSDFICFLDSEYQASVDLEHFTIVCFPTKGLWRCSWNFTLFEHALKHSYGTVAFSFGSLLGLCSTI